LSPLSRFHLLPWHNYCLNAVTLHCLWLFLRVGLVICLVGNVLVTCILQFRLFFPHAILALRVACRAPKQPHQFRFYVFSLDFLIFIFFLLLKYNFSQTFAVEAMILMRWTNAHTVK
jgi:hypothetical protein